MSRNRLSHPLIWLGAGLSMILGIIALWRWRHKPDTEEGRLLPAQIKPSEIGGLSEEEAAARWQEGQDNVIEIEQHDRKQIIRQGTFTIFNLNLVALAAVQVLLGKPLDALITLGVLIANVAVVLFQEEFARRRLRSVRKASRPQATVIRQSTVRSIDPAEIVVGDALVISPGDQAFVDGRILGSGTIKLDESPITGKNTTAEKTDGDILYAGSLCLEGRAVYRAERIGDERSIIRRLRTETQTKKAFTPIEQMLNQIMRALLMVVFALAIILVAGYLRLDSVQSVDPFVDAISVLFNIAPAGLFFMVLLTYVAATADIAAVGALVNRTRSIESMAQVDTLCLAKTGIITGTAIKITPLVETEDLPYLSGQHIHQVLGDVAQTLSVQNAATRAIKATLPGTKRAVKAEAPYLSVYGWSGMVFADPDLQGTFVLAESHLLPHKERQPDPIPKETPVEDARADGRISVSTITRPLGNLVGRFRRKKPEEEPDHALPPAPDLSPQQAASEPEISPAPDPSSQRNFFGRIRQRVDSLLDVVEVQVATSEMEDGIADDGTALIFAYAPQELPLHTPEGVPQLPTQLQAVCAIRYEERVHPETITALETFRQRGVSLKIFTPDPQETTVSLLTTAGLRVNGDETLPAINGEALKQMTAAERHAATDSYTVFAQVTPRQTAQLIKSMQQANHHVAMVGDDVSDLDAMRQADLAIALHTSSPAALSMAEIVLLRDSPSVLSKLVDKGQRIVNGLLDILKLYITQAFYLTLLIIAVFVLARSFPYTSAQGGMIAIVTLTLPAIGLTLWARSGILPTSNLRRILFRFTVPAALTMAAMGTLIYLLFLQRGGDRAYAQVAEMHILVAMGLMLVIFISPPIRFRLWQTPQLGDLKPTLLVTISALLFVIATYIPLAQRLLKIEPLEQLAHYGVIGIATLGWAVSILFLWAIVPLSERVRYSLATTPSGETGDA